MIVFFIKHILFSKILTFDTESQWTKTSLIRLRYDFKIRVSTIILQW